MFREGAEGARHAHALAGGAGIESHAPGQVYPLGDSAALDSGAGPGTLRSVERIVPAETRETGKVGIARVQLRAVLDREGSEVRVVYEVARRSEWFEEVPDDRRMTIAWMDDDGTRLSQPTSDDVQCPVRR